MKNAVVYEEAKRLYVHSGLSVEMIAELLKEKVSKRTIFNWKQENNWDEQRTRAVEVTGDIQAELTEIVKLSIQRVKEEPSAQNIFALIKAILALKSLQGIRFEDEEEVPEKKAFRPETIDKIQREILGL